MNKISLILIGAIVAGCIFYTAYFLGKRITAYQFFNQLEGACRNSHPKEGESVWYKCEADWKLYFKNLEIKEND